MNIEIFYVWQWELVEVVEIMLGVCCWCKSVFIEKVGLYIFGGIVFLFLVVFMFGVFVMIVGCWEWILCMFFDKNGKVNFVIFYIVDFVGIMQIFKIGGVQVIGAMIYGIVIVFFVYKIFGFGNQYVIVVKQLASWCGVVIDMFVGLLEVFVCVDDIVNLVFVVADLFL